MYLRIVFKISTSSLLFKKMWYWVFSELYIRYVSRKLVFCREDLTNKKEDLLKIFEAVRNEDCSPIRCESSENPT